MKKKILTVAMTTAMLISPASAFKVEFYYGALGTDLLGKPNHEEITREALESISLILEDGSRARLAPDFITALVEENTENDELGLNYGQMHFDDSRLEDSAAYIWSAKNQALRAFQGGDTLTLDGYGVPTNLGSAMHTIQDFFAHSTWVEINQYRAKHQLNALTVPQIGIVEHPFAVGMYSTLKKLDVQTTYDSNAIPISDGVCNLTNVLAPTDTLTSAYYDFAMSKIGPLYPSTDHGFSTDKWVGEIATRMIFLDRVSTYPPRKIDWPRGRCVHGGDLKSAGGINKDQSDREGYFQARAAAVYATQAFMLNFLAESGALLTQNKTLAKTFLIEHEEPTPTSGVQTGAGSATTGNIPSLYFAPRPTNFSVVFNGLTKSYGNVTGASVQVTSTNWPSRMLGYSFENTPCEVVRAYPLDDLSDLTQDQIICPSIITGPGKLRIFQTALPYKDGLSTSRILHTETLTLNAVPPASVADIQPPVITISQTTRLTITGSNLPSTIKMSLGGIDCTTQSGATSSSFSATCTPGGTAGLQQVIITDTNTGSVIDASKQVNVGAAAVVCTPPQVLQGVGCVTPAPPSLAILGSGWFGACTQININYSASAYMGLDPVSLDGLQARYFEGSANFAGVSCGSLVSPYPGLAGRLVVERAFFESAAPVFEVSVRPEYSNEIRRGRILKLVGDQVYCADLLASELGRPIAEWPSLAPCYKRAPWSP